MSLTNKTSLLIPNQLPEYIRDDPNYANFVAFLQAYYEWLESPDVANTLNTSVSTYNQGATYAAKNLLNYLDIDNVETSTSGFIDYYVNDFLQYFPADALINKDKALKIARQLYKSKGTPASYEFLFRILYNSSFDYFYTKDTVLKASAGTWYIAKSLKLATTDPNFLNIKNYRVFGETTKTIATVENSILAQDKTEVFISNIERLFQSGEIIRVVDSNNQDVLVNGQPLRAKLVGQLSQVNIDPNNRGLLYSVGDPAIVYGGLNSNIANPIGATAVVSQTTTGSVQRINLINGGYGYTQDSNTIISFTNLNAGAAVPLAIVGSIDPSSANTANVFYVPKDSITLKRFTQLGNADYYFANATSANANTTLAEAFTFEAFSLHPISSVIVENGGGGISTIPTVTASMTYPTDDPSYNGYISSLGILAPIQILNGGEGYLSNDKIQIIGGRGYGAYANITSVNSIGAITSVDYVLGSNNVTYPPGGLGYTNDLLPTVKVISSNIYASNASLYVPGILGTGATFQIAVDRAGSITTISLTNPGEDYIATPNVSLKVQDIVVSNVNVFILPQKGDVIYQGVDLKNASYVSYFDSISLLQGDAVSANSLYNMRLYNYSSQPNVNLPLIDANNNVQIKMTGIQYVSPTLQKPDGTSYYNTSGVRNYGDGTALATASFLNGLAISQGQYLTSQGQPSSYDVLQSSDYNNFTYQITVEKEIAKYREILLNLIHPSGTKLIGRYAIRSANTFYYTSSDSVFQGYPLTYLTGYSGITVSMKSSPSAPANNIITINNLPVGENIANIIAANALIEISPPNGPEISSYIKSIDPVNNTITLQTNTWLTFANVAYITANANSNVINIVSVTNSYNIVNNGVYSNTMYPIKDIVFAGDTVYVNNQSLTVTSVNYGINEIVVNGNVSSNISNSLLTVSRTINTDLVNIFQPLGTEYISYLTDTTGNVLVTQTGTPLIV